jgi:hypothetical protein
MISAIKPQALVWACLMVSVFASMALAKRKWPESIWWLHEGKTNHLGAEHRCVAKAIASGEGFSNPFHDSSGPTAWIAPAFPYLLAGLYVLLGDDPTLVEWCVLAFQSGVVLFTVWLVLREAQHLHAFWIGVASVGIGLSGHYFHLFQHTHDWPLQLLFVNLFWISCSSINRLRVRPWMVGLLGGASVLANPTLICPWLYVLRRQRYTAKALALAFATFSCVTAPWYVRNRVVLGKWIPIKSNLMFEAWQSQCWDADGILEATTLREHPWTKDGDMRKEYRELGEITFIESYAAKYRQSIAVAPSDLLKRIANRFVAACGVYAPYYSNERYYWFYYYWKCATHPLAFFSALLVIAAGSRLKDCKQINAICIYALFLLPYIFVSYYTRYAIPLVGIKMLLMLYGFTLIYKMATVWTEKVVRSEWHEVNGECTISKSRQQRLLPPHPGWSNPPNRSVKNRAIEASALNS